MSAPMLDTSSLHNLFGELNKLLGSLIHLWVVPRVYVAPKLSSFPASSN